MLTYPVVLFLDNVLLALSRKTSRRNARRGASWGNSTISTTDTSTLNLLSRHPHSRNASRSPSRSAPLSRVTSTANIPLSRTQTRVSVPSQPKRDHEHRRGRSEPGEIRHDVIDFAYHTPSHSHSSSEVDQIGLAISPPLPERNPSRGQNKKGKGKGKQKMGYESMNWTDEQGSDREDMRNLARARTS